MNLITYGYQDALKSIHYSQQQFNRGNTKGASAILGAAIEKCLRLREDIDGEDEQAREVKR